MHSADESSSMRLNALMRCDRIVHNAQARADRVVMLARIMRFTCGESPTCSTRSADEFVQHALECARALRQNSPQRAGKSRQSRHARQNHALHMRRIAHMLNELCRQNRPARARMRSCVATESSTTRRQSRRSRPARQNYALHMRRIAHMLNELCRQNRPARARMRSCVATESSTTRRQSRHYGLLHL